MRPAFVTAAAASTMLLLLGGWLATPSARAEGSVGGVVSYPDGSPGAGIEVYISPNPPPVGSYMTREALTDASGHWTYGPLPPGAYMATFVVVDSTGSRETQATKSFTVGEGEQVSLTTSLSGPPGPGEGTLTGTVTASTGLPAGNAQIALTWSGAWTPPPVEIDASGSFKAVLLAGTYGLSIRREDTEADSSGAETLEATVTVSAGETSNVVYTLPVAPPLPVPLGTAAVNTAKDLGYLNQERRRWGLLGSLSANTDWSQACAAHETYMAANPNALADGISPHTELPEKAGYSPGGAWGGEHSVLGGADWAAEANPWEDGPIHLNQLFAPDILQVGIDESHGGACATTWPGVGAPSLPTGTVLTYPGDGTTGLPPAEDAAEWPFTPGSFVGIPEKTIAGRELFVYEEQPPVPGPCAGFCFARAPTVAAASLSGPDGPVEVRSVDGSNVHVGGYLMGAIVIPVKSLEPHATYTASVTLAGSVFPVLPEVSHRWSFTTGASNPSGLWRQPASVTPREAGAAPRLSHLKVSPRTFRPAKRGQAKHGGASVSYHDNTVAVTTLTILHAVAGRSRGRSCLAPSRASRRRPRCTRLVRVYALVHRDRRGRNELGLTGRVGSRPLPPGAYRLRAQARVSGTTGPAISTPFEVAS
jgi:hypothetical protein